ncbi:MAG: BolA/IbaG family iron-sulfur metabolism protein [Gammaproteobacteria bacterium]|nr:BolA/IbaG family iron-sulfur metabolism protein [Gammaproteobacteria bacterium]
MSVQSDIHDTLVEALSPVYLDVLNESHNHNVPPDSETHFKVVVVTEAFKEQTLIKRHRSLNTLLAEFLAGPVHALSLHTHTPEEWQSKGETVPESPPCLGGGR